MKIVNNQNLKFFILAVILAMVISKNLLKNKNADPLPSGSSAPSTEVKIDSNYNPSHTPTVIRDLMLKVKKQDPKDNDLHAECLKLMLGIKNNELMSIFWDGIKKSQLTPNAKIGREIFANFINANTDGVVVEEGPRRDCNKIVGANLIDNSEFENPKKQKELNDIVYPYFPRPIKRITDKNIITAFIGVHRDTEEGKNLIPILNGQKN